MRVPISLLCCLHLLLAVVLIIVILVDVKSYLIVVLICVSLMTKECNFQLTVTLEHYFIIRLLGLTSCARDSQRNKTTPPSLDSERRYARNQGKVLMIHLVGFHSPVQTLTTEFPADF